MKIKTSELIGPALDYAVALCEGLDVESAAARKAAHIEDWMSLAVRPVKDVLGYCDRFYASKYVKHGLLGDIPRYSSKWSQAGTIIEREGIAIRPTWDGEVAGWITMKGRFEWTGPTPLVAAMRCYVASKIGDEVDIPEELLK